MIIPGKDVKIGGEYRIAEIGKPQHNTKGLLTDVKVKIIDVLSFENDWIGCNVELLENVYCGPKKRKNIHRAEGAQLCFFRLKLKKA